MNSEELRRTMFQAKRIITKRKMFYQRMIDEGYDIYMVYRSTDIYRRPSKQTKGQHFEYAFQDDLGRKASYRTLIDVRKAITDMMTEEVE